jgi:toxin ParE1/3/4
MKVILSELAEYDISQIFDYYFENAGVKVARQERSKIVNRIKILKDFPLIGRKEENEKVIDSDCRYLVQGNYKILYEVEENRIVILTIFNTIQDPSKMSI